MPDFNMVERQQIESKLKKCFILAVYVIENDKSIKKNECPFRIDCSPIKSLSVATLRMEKIRGEQKNVTRICAFFLILSVRLCSWFIAGVHGIIRI